MDQKLMLNGNFLCKDITPKEIVTESGFVIEHETKFRTVEVISSNDKDVPLGSHLVVPYHTGQVYEDELMIIKRKDIIYIE